MGNGQWVNGEWSMVNQCCRVKNQTSVVSYFASGRQASYLTDNLFERCGEACEQATKRLRADYTEFR
jgi:hypothetical protein